MLTYLKRLQDERDSLTQTATSMTETAAADGRDLTDTEAASLTSMSERCAAIDGQLTTYGAQLDSQRAYAELRSRLGADDTPEPGRTAPRNGRPPTDDANSWGEMFLRAGVIDGYTGHGSSRPVEVGSALETRAPITTADSPYPPQLIAPPTAPSFPSVLLSLVQTLRTNSGSVAWIYADPQPPGDAAVVAEGALKPEAVITLQTLEQALQTYAHYKAITRQALDDIPQIRSIIEGYLRAGLQSALEAATAAAINTNVTIPAATGASMLAAARVGMATVQENGYTPNGLLLNPADWADIDLAMMGGTLNGAAVNNAPFGLRIAASGKVPAGTGYVGDFKEGVTLFDRGVTNVYLSDSHADFFLRNQLVLLAEARALPVVTTPLALVKITSTGAMAATATPAASTK